jgi:thioredoxin 2
LPAESAPIDVDDEAFAAIAEGARVPVLVDFWAPWCGPCRSAAPEVKRAASELAGRALVLKVNTDDHPRLASQFGVRGIPHFVVLKQGRPVFSQSGAVNAAALVRYVEAGATPTTP